MSRGGHPGYRQYTAAGRRPSWSCHLISVIHTEARGAILLSDKDHGAGPAALAWLYYPTI